MFSIVRLLYIVGIYFILLLREQHLRLFIRCPFIITLRFCVRAVPNFNRNKTSIARTRQVGGKYFSSKQKQRRSPVYGMTSDTRHRDKFIMSHAPGAVRTGGAADGQRDVRDADL